MIKKVMELPYYQNVELATILGTSQVSIARYIKKALDKEIDLSLIKTSTGHRVERNDLNLSVLKSITGNKDIFKNKPKYNVISPTQEFFDSYTEYEINEILINLNSYFINFKHIYVGQGAKIHAEHVLRNDLMDKYIFCLANQLPFLLEYARKNNIVFRVIEFRPARMSNSVEFLKSIYAADALHMYHAVDISKDIISLTKQSFKDNFPDRLYKESVIDFQNKPLTNFKYKTNTTSDGRKIVNLLLCLGATFCNFMDFESLIKNISFSMNQDDFLCYDMPYKPTDYHLEYEVPYESTIAVKLGRVAPLLGISDLDASLIMKYDQEKKERSLNAVFKKNTELNVKGFKIRFDKNEKIKLFIHRIADLAYDTGVAETNGLSLNNFTSSYDCRTCNLLFQKVKIVDSENTKQIT